jgi:hypothetical protein
VYVSGENSLLRWDAHRTASYTTNQGPHTKRRQGGVQYILQGAPCQRKGETISLGYNRVAVLVTLLRSLAGPHVRLVVAGSCRFGLGGVTSAWGISGASAVCAQAGLIGYQPSPSGGEAHPDLDTIARTVLEDICDKPIRIQSYCAVARLHGV